MLTIKKGDTRNAIVATLNKNGTSVDLTGCDVLISISGKVFEAYCQVLDAPNGKVMYALEQNITNTTGIYKYEFIVRHEDGRQETFPNNDYLKLYIMDEVK